MPAPSSVCIFILSLHVALVVMQGWLSLPAPSSLPGPLLAHLLGEAATGVLGIAAILYELRRGLEKVGHRYSLLITSL